TFGKAGLQRNTRRRVAAEETIGERVDLIKCQAHLSSGFSQRDRTLHIENAAAGDGDTLAAMLAGEIADARGELPRLEPRLAEALRPIGNERAMRRAGHGIFVDIVRGCEKARDEVDVAVAWRGGNDHA